MNQPTSIESIRERFKSRTIVHMVEEVAALSQYPVRVLGLVDDGPGCVMIYLSAEDYRLYQIGLKDGK